MHVRCDCNGKLIAGGEKKTKQNKRNNVITLGHSAQEHMPAGTTWGAVWVHYWSCTSHSVAPSVLLSQMCLCMCVSVCVHAHVCKCEHAHISLLCARLTLPWLIMSAEPLHGRETEGPEVAERITWTTQWCQDPLFSLCCRQILENRSKERTVSDDDREADGLLIRTDASSRWRESLPYRGALTFSSTAALFYEWIEQAWWNKGVISQFAHSFMTMPNASL